jgi:predicted enzyme related to lactoylglutathione lyase
VTVAGTAVVWLPVSDVQTALGFYRDRLQLEALHAEDEWAELDANGLRIGLNAREKPGGNGGAVVAFQVDGAIEDAVEDLRSQGVEFAGELSEHPWGRVAVFKDPDGNDLQLYAPPGD